MVATAPKPHDVDKSTESAGTVEAALNNNAEKKGAAGSGESQTEKLPEGLPVKVVAARKRAPSAKARFVFAAFFIALGVTAFLVLAFRLGEQPSILIALMTAALSCMALFTEAYCAISTKALRNSPFSFLPLLGSALVCAAVFVAVFSSANGAVTPLIAAAPALAVATLLLGNAWQARGFGLSRGDSQYLYPRPVASAQGVRLGDVVSYTAGTVISVDGRIQKGCIAVDERRVSSVSIFRIREEQEIVYAGSEVIAGGADVVALTSPSEATLHQMQDALTPLLEEAQGSLEREDAKAARWSGLAIVFLAVAVGIFWHERSTGYVQALLAAGTVALFGSVCLVSAVLYGWNRSLVQSWVRRGYLLGTPTSRRDLAAIEAVECDPSRCGEGSLLKVATFDVLDDRLEPAALCEFLCALLGRAEAPVLAAAGEYCRRRSKTPSTERVLELKEYLGRGICGVVHGVELSIGSEDFLVERGIMIQPSDGGGYSSGEQLVLVAIDDDVVARIHVANDQSDVVPTEGFAVWNGAVAVSTAPGVAQSLGAERLLVRGNESDLVARIARSEVTFFDPEEGLLRRSTVVAFNPELAPLEGLLDECRSLSRTVDRMRLLIGFGGLMVLGATFMGAVTPLVPLIVLAFVGTVVHLSHRNGSVLVSRSSFGV